MKIGFNPGSIVDASGAPLQGRVLVYVHDSLEKKSIYTLQGSDYVASENPVLFDTTGRIPTTLFFDVGVVDVLVQKYVGEPGHLADESPDEDFEDFDLFEAGFDFDPEKEASRTVETIADLKDIENPSGIVRVNCYTMPGDTFPRYYLWNPNCMASEDGGCVIADTNDASGMWCYLCEGDSIKSSVYGIKPGTDETNLNAFCNAPFGVSGDYVVTYPITLYMESGTYSSIYSYYVVECRKVVFSCKAKFTTSTFYLDDFDVDGRNTDYIANFYVYNGHRRKSLAVHSSWFRDAFYLWNEFGVIYLESDNYFENNSFSSSVLVHGSTIIGNNAYYQPTFTSDGHLYFDNCTFVGSKLFQHYGFKAIFKECNFSDKLFVSMNYSNVDFGLLSQGHSLQVDSWQITDALDADVWLAWAKANNVEIVNLCGKVVKNIGTNSFTYLMNGIVSGTVLCNSNIVIDGIIGNPEIAGNTPGKTLTVKNSVVSIGNSVFSSVTCVNSNIGNFDVDTSTTELSIVGGSFSGIIKCSGWDSASGTHTRGKAVSFRDCVLSLGSDSWFDCVRMHNCTIDNPIHVIPYAENSELWLDAIFVGNTFGSNGYIVFGDSSVANADIYNVKVKNLIIKDNVFNTSGDGVTMPYYSNNAFEPYIAPLQGVNANYSGNIGSCPAESIDYGPNKMQTLFVQDQGTYKRSLAVRRVWNLNKYAVFNHGSGLMISADNTQSMFVGTYLFHQRSIENAGDQFDVFIAVSSGDYVATSIFKAFDK